MQERVEGLGGKFAFESQNGGGSRVCVSIPVIEAASTSSRVGDAIVGAQA